MNLIDLYEPVCGCVNTIQECPNTVNDSKSGIIPRGFYTVGSQTSVVVLIVGKNPGHVLADEIDLYLNKTSKQLVQGHLDFAGKLFNQCTAPEFAKNRSLIFHRNILRYFSYFLDVAPAEVFIHCAYTNIVKCQTTGEQDPLQKATINTCLNNHFRRELAYFSPKIIVALGGESFNALSKLHFSIPLLKIKHPSYFYRKDVEAENLRKLKDQIQFAIKQ